MALTKTCVTTQSPSTTPASGDLHHQDCDLERRVRNFLAGRNVPSLRRLEVQVESGLVTISGRLKTYYEKQLALHCCQRVAGVITMVDAIEVQKDKAGGS